MSQPRKTQVTCCFSRSPRRKGWAVCRLRCGCGHLGMGLGDPPTSVVPPPPASLVLEAPSALKSPKGLAWRWGLSKPWIESRGWGGGAGTILYSLDGASGGSAGVSDPQGPGCLSRGLPSSDSCNPGNSSCAPGPQHRNQGAPSLWTPAPPLPWPRAEPASPLRQLPPPPGPAWLVPRLPRHPPPTILLDSLQDSDATSQAESCSCPAQLGFWLAGSRAGAAVSQHPTRGGPHGVFTECIGNR